MVHFARHPASRAVMLTFLSTLAAVAVAAQDDTEKTFDCKFTVGESKYDLSELAGELEVSRDSGLPPSTIQDKLTLNLCGALTHKDDVPADEQVSAMQATTALCGGCAAPAWAAGIGWAVGLLGCL